MRDVKKETINKQKLRSKKYYLLVLGATLLITIMLPQNAYAALQSNPSTHYGTTKKNPTQWMSEIRQMEAPNNAMGLKEEFNRDLTTKDGTPSNNIDVHMMRNTEYGAIAILAVSGYGNPNTMEKSTIQSTTGNATGVYYKVDSSNNSFGEVVASGLDGYVFSGINKRYYDEYSSKSGVFKIGDAMDLKWQEIGRTCYWVNTEAPYTGRNFEGYFRHTNAYSNASYNSRGVAVCGQGF